MEDCRKGWVISYKRSWVTDFSITTQLRYMWLKLFLFELKKENKNKDEKSTEGKTSVLYDVAITRRTACDKGSYHSPFP